MEPLFKLSVNIPDSQAKRLRKLRSIHGLSASSIVEVALAAYLDGQPDATVARRAQKEGATLRRTRSGSNR